MWIAEGEEEWPNEGATAAVECGSGSAIDHFIRYFRLDVSDLDEADQEAFQAACSEGRCYASVTVVSAVQAFGKAFARTSFMWLAGSGDDHGDRETVSGYYTSSTFGGQETERNAIALKLPEDTGAEDWSKPHSLFARVWGDVRASCLVANTGAYASASLDTDGSEAPLGFEAALWIAPSSGRF